MADLTLTITIVDLKVPQAKLAFFAKHPRPTDEEHPDFGLSDKELFEKWLSGKVNRELQLGQRQLDTPPPDTTDYFS